MDCSEEEIFKYVRNELATKIVEELINNRKVKIEIASQMNDDFGMIVKVRASVQAYNPDD